MNIFHHLHVTDKEVVKRLKCQLPLLVLSLCIQIEFLMRIRIGDYEELVFQSDEFLCKRRHTCK